MKVERRRRRSPLLGTALHYQLDACAERAGLHAMLVASPDGLLVASSRNTSGLEMDEQIAVHVADVHPHQLVVRHVREPESPPRTVTARGFEVDGQRLVVCAVGRPSASAVDEIYRAMGGVSRILSR